MTFLTRCIVFKKERKKVKLIHHDCLPILMLLYIILYILQAYIMLFAFVFNAVCLHTLLAVKVNIFSFANFGVLNNNNNNNNNGYF